MSEPLADRLQAYLRARGDSDVHALRTRRGALLPDLRAGAAELDGRADLAGAVAVLEDAVGSAIGEPDPADVALLANLQGRLDALAAPALRVPILLAEVGGAGAVVDELSVEVLRTPGRGRTWTAQSADPAAEAAAVHGGAAATALLRRLGYRAEPGDLDVAWSTGVADRARIEGPSLGLALALAVLARTTERTLPGDIAVTGAVAADGGLAAVAGGPAKARAAADAGFARLLVPRGTDVGAVPAGLQVAFVGRLAEAAAVALGLRGRPARPMLVPLSLSTAMALVVLFGLLDLPAVLGYPVVAQPLPRAEITDRVVLVPWDRSQGGGTAEADGVDFAEFADHRSYRATHPQVLRRLSEAGATVVLLDAWIRGGDREATAVIAAAIADATAAGTTIVLPSRADAGRWDPPDDALVAGGAAVGFAAARAEGPRRLVRSARLARPGAAAGPRWSLATLAVARLSGVEPEALGDDRIVFGARTLGAPGGVRLVRFPDAPDYRRYAYADVFAGRFDPAHVAGRVVVLGAAQGDADRHRTPSGTWYGVEIQAAIVSSLLSDRPRLEEVDRSSRAGAAALLALGCALSVAAARRRRRSGLRAAIVVVAYVGLAGFVSVTAMNRAVYWPWTDGVAAALLVAAFELWRRRREGRALSGAG